MAYTQTVTNDEGEILGIETHYDDEPGYYDDDFDNYGPEDYYDDEPDDYPYGYSETPVGTEYIDDEDYPGTRQVAPTMWDDLCANPDLG